MAGQQAATCRPADVVHHTTASASPAETDNVQATVIQQPSAGSHAPIGRHILLEYYKIPSHLFAPLTDTHTLRRTFSALIQKAGMTYLGDSCHVFTGTDAVTCVFLLSESHLSIHTWPEHGFAALDIFTCGTAAHPDIIEQGWQELLQPGLVVRAEQARGGLRLNKLTSQQQAAKVLHTLPVSGNDDGESVGQVLMKVPVLHSSSSPYQSLMVVEVPGQLGRCLLLDNTIQFCSHDLDGYTDHMARYPLQLLQAIRGCGQAGSLGAGDTGPGTSAAQSGAPLVAKPELPPAASSATPGHVTCRTSLLRQPATAAAGAGARNITAVQECQKLQQRKLRVLLVGGGDGWIAGHLISCYGDYVESVTAVELDKTVSDVTERYFGHMRSGGSPYNHPRITWQYTDAYAWVKQRVAHCSDRTSPAAAQQAAAAAANADAASHSNLPASATEAAPPAGAPVAAAAALGRRLGHSSSTASTKDVAHTTHTTGGSLLSSDVAGSTIDCAGFDVVVIDSTDFTVQAAAKLHSSPFYHALYRLMSPRAALIQIVQSYLRASP